MVYPTSLLGSWLGGAKWAANAKPSAARYDRLRFQGLAAPLSFVAKTQGALEASLASLLNNAVGLFNKAPESLCGARRLGHWEGSACFWCSRDVSLSVWGFRYEPRENVGNTRDAKLGIGASLLHILLGSSKFRDPEGSSSMHVAYEGTQVICCVFACAF